MGPGSPVGPASFAPPIAGGWDPQPIYGRITQVAASLICESPTVIQHR
jgi:hypothetical protein